VTAPAYTPSVAVSGAPESENAKNAPPVTAMTNGVVAAATPQPRYWNTRRPASISAMVA